MSLRLRQNREKLVKKTLKNLEKIFKNFVLQIWVVECCLMYAFEAISGTDKSYRFVILIEHCSGDITPERVVFCPRNP